MAARTWATLLLLVANVVTGRQTPFSSRSQIVSTEETNVASEFDTLTADHRPSFRYWFPDASIDHQVLENDIRALKDIGGGGLELLPFYNYGFGGPDISKYETYAFGKPAFKEVLVTALESCKANGLVMDFALGANQGQGVPSEPLTPGLAVQLVYGKIHVRGGTRFEGALPEPDVDWNQFTEFMAAQEVFGNSHIVGVSAGAIKSSKSYNDSKVEVVLDEASLIDLSSETVDGKLTWQVPSSHEDWIIFASYERYTNQRSCVGVPTDIIANGSWVTDHFSSAGAKLVTEFWEQNLLDDEVRKLLKAVVRHSWEDSMEIQAALYWTPNFLGRFEVARKYNPVKYLPLLFQKSTSFVASPGAPYNTTFYLDESEKSGQSKYLQDYRLTLNEGYREYLAALETWAQSLGISHSCQVAYNMPVDMLADVPLVTQPELESLGFPSIDDMLQYVGPAHLFGRNIISTEIGAMYTGAYSQSIPSLLNLFQDAFAAGVNAMVIHGMRYGGETEGTTWPGYTTFQYTFTEMWGPHMPAWNHMNDIMDYTSRNQLILRAGVAKKDLVFYLYNDPYVVGSEHDGHELRAEGFTYEYLSPANLVSEAASVESHILAPNGPGYKALIINQQRYISPEATDKLLEFAAQGLPLVVIGSLPNTTIGSRGQDIVSAKITELSSANYSNVRFIPSYSDLLSTLNDLAITPRVHSTSSTTNATQHLYTVLRSDGPTKYIFLYNKNASATFDISFSASTSQIPYTLNAWTGGKAAIAVYTRSDGRITIPLTLASHQTALIGLYTSTSTSSTNHYNTPNIQITSHTPNILSTTISTSSSTSPRILTLLLTNPDPATLTLSNHTSVLIPPSLPSPSSLPHISLSPWNLTLTSYLPRSLNNTSDAASTTQILHLGPQAILLPWSRIPELANASGVGVYTSTFSLPVLPYQSSIYLLLGQPILNTIRVRINSQPIPPIDIFDPRVDITSFLRTPSSPHQKNSPLNEIQIEVSSTLFNAVKSNIAWIKTNGVGPVYPQLYTLLPLQEHGLVGPVEIKVYRKVELEV